MVGRAPHWRVVLPTVGIAILLASVGGWVGVLSIAPGASAHPAVPSNSTSWSVQATSGYAFTESVTELAPNATIALTVDNVDSIVHDFVLVKVEGKVIPPSADVLSWIDKYGSIVFQNLSATTSYSLEFSSPGVGWYEFVCTYHFSLGMYGFIAFGEPLPGNLTVASAATVGWQIFVIGGTIVALLILAIVLALLPRGRQRTRPPPRPPYGS